MRIQLSLVALLVAVPALAQDFSEADLSGRYAFTIEDPSNQSFPVRWQVGSWIADGQGGIQGERVLLYTHGTNQEKIGRLQQTFVGTYTVGASGIGTAVLTFDPAPPDSVRAALSFSATEEVDFVLASGGEEVFLTIRHVALNLSGSSVGFTRLNAGVAKRQDASPSAPGVRDLGTLRAR